MVSTAQLQVNSCRSESEFIVSFSVDLLSYIFSWSWIKLPCPIYPVWVYLPELVWSLSSVEPDWIPWSEKPSVHNWPGVDARHPPLQQVIHLWSYSYHHASHACVLWFWNTTVQSLIHPFLSLSSVQTMTLTPPSRPTCWSTPVASLSISLQVSPFLSFLLCWYYIQYQSKVWTHLLIQEIFFICTIFYIVE